MKKTALWRVLFGDRAIFSYEFVVACNTHESAVSTATAVLNDMYVANPKLQTTHPRPPFAMVERQGEVYIP